MRYDWEICSNSDLIGVFLNGDIVEDRRDTRKEMIICDCTIKQGKIRFYVRISSIRSIKCNCAAIRVWLTCFWTENWYDKDVRKTERIIYKICVMWEIRINWKILGRDSIIQLKGCSKFDSMDESLWCSIAIVRDYKE